MAKVYQTLVLSLVVTVLLGAGLQGCATVPGSGNTLDTNISSQEVNIRLDLAESYLNSGEPRRALAELKLIEKRARNQPRFQYDLGLTYLGLKEWEQAAQNFQKAVKLDPEFAEASVSLGHAYAAMGQLDRAEEAFKYALGILTYLTPEYAAYNLALVYSAQGKTERAEEYARMAIERNWRYTPAYLLLSDTLVAQGKTSEAIAWLKRGTEADLENPALLLRLGENLLREGEPEEAKQWFARVIEISATSKEAKVARDYLEIL
ncbi:MAG: tetratricopeptide repeat protein [Desulfovibrionales bacterium]